MYLIFCFEEKGLRIENFRNNSSAVLLSISLKNKVSNSSSGCAMLFYKISSTVKLALLELHRFGLAGQCDESKKHLVLTFDVPRERTNIQ